MKTPCFRLVVGFLVAGAASSFVYGQDNPPVITGITLEIARTLGLSPLFGPWESYVAFNPATEVAREGDRIRLTVHVLDADMPDDELYVRKSSIWWPYGNYFAPEPETVGGDTPEFIAPPGLQTGEGTATITFVFVIPEWVGPNQARLRNLINWDVRWIVNIEVSNAEDPDEDTYVDIFAIILYAVENPDFRPANPPPFANGGADQTVPVGSTVELDGSRTFDAFNIGFDPIDPEVFEKDYLEYVWEWLTGPQRVDPIYRDPDRPYAAEVTLNMIGTYTYRLSVTDGVNPLPSTDNVTITVVTLIPENQAPLAVIVAPAEPVIAGALITLDGTLSADPDGDLLSYRWRQTDEVGGDIPPGDFTELFQPLSGLEAPLSTWQAARPGTYYFRLIVDDGELRDTATASVEVIEPGSAGIVVEQDSGAGQAADPAGFEDSPVFLPGMVGCGGSLLPLALLPLLLWPLRGRIR